MKMPSSTGISRPFPCVPTSDRYLAIGPIEEARIRLCQMIDRGEGLGVVIAPPGTGKTLLCQRIAAQYRASHAVVLLGDIRVSSRLGLIQQVLFHLRQPRQGSDEQSLQLALIESLTKGVDSAKTLLLIIDEAQMLSLDLLDEIRMLTNLVRDGRPLVQTILAGGPKLEDPLADPQAESLAQRIVVRCYLHPMTYGESVQYTRSMLAASALKIDDKAVGSVHHACAGVPRLINQLMNQATDYATLRRMAQIDDACIQHAWAELQQLPSPLLEPNLKSIESAIEFGELDDDTAACEMESIEFGDPNPTLLEPALLEPGPDYVDMESIFNSPSILCAADALTNLDSHIVDSQFDQVPVTLRPQIAMSAAELFGNDFEAETTIDLHAASGISRDRTAGGMNEPVPHAYAEPACEELSLRDDILQLSQTAKAAATSALPWAANARQEQKQSPPMATSSDSVDVPRAMAVVWHDEAPVATRLDDRDMLVIEDEVSLIVDSPQISMIGSGALRRPTQSVDQEYHDLFSRLRRGE